ncbi:hypothetical protein MMC15_007714 [Xylographa vitiligo]|nr:hypothetical protein [Xylographa vitiligo]
MAKRRCTHAGSWYSAHGTTLSKDLDTWLNQVPDNIQDVGKVPQPHARAIIAPHAGYAYSGPAAAWAYKSLDLSKAKRIFLLGPSHHFYLPNCALSQCTHYSTPLGDLLVDTQTVAELHKTGKFGKMSKSVDEDEHSLEMHLPYIYKVLSKSFPPNELPPLVPILVGNTKPEKEREYGDILAPYLEDENNVFIVSSDFCHWGLRFSYTYYLPAANSAPTEGVNLRSRDKATGSTIYDSIERIDRLAMNAIESGSHDTFINNLQGTGNTICGRHPIGIVMCALENLKGALKLNSLTTDFKFIRYERSSQCKEVSDSSVSYASAFARVECEDVAAQFEDDIGTKSRGPAVSQDHASTMGLAS